MFYGLFRPLAALLLILAISTAGFIFHQPLSALLDETPVRGVSGSEKLPFFRDSQTLERFAQSPFDLQTDVEKAGSRQIATSYDLSKYDFAFPAGIPAAEKIRQENGIKKSYQPFSTPMVIATWQPVAQLLQANGLVKRQPEGYYTLDMRKMFKLMLEHKRWTDLKKSELYPANKSVLITTTDIRKSNSAAMYLALASYVLNQSNVVQSLDEARPIIDDLSQLFMRQGFTESSSQAPFENYLSMGPGKTPLVMIYEAQFLYEAAKENSAIRDDMVLLYPTPTLFTKHVLVPMTPAGEAVGEALTHDPQLQAIATRHGLRTQNIRLFNQFVREKNLQSPDYLVDVIEPPSYAVLEGMIRQIEHQYSTNARAQ